MRCTEIDWQLCTSWCWHTGMMFGGLLFPPPPPLSLFVPLSSPFCGCAAAESSVRHTSSSNPAREREKESEREQWTWRARSPVTLPHCRRRNGPVARGARAVVPVGVVATSAKRHGLLLSHLLTVGSSLTSLLSGLLSPSLCSVAASRWWSLRATTGSKRNSARTGHGGCSGIGGIVLRLRGDSGKTRC